MLIGTAYFGFPVSTTHATSTSITGVDAIRRLSAVEWGPTRDTPLAWLPTLPTAALVGGVFAVLSRMIFGAG